MTANHYLAGCGNAECKDGVDEGPGYGVIMRSKDGIDRGPGYDVIMQSARVE